jgi:transposase
MNAGWRSRPSLIQRSRSFFQDQLEVINAAQVRLAALEQQMREIVPTWTMAPVVAAYQALRGVSFLVAVTFVAEVGDVRRFATAQQLMAFIGLVPSERTTGDTVRRGSITKTGNHRARRVLIEGAWTYRFSARVGETLRARVPDTTLGSWFPFARCGRAEAPWAVNERASTIQISAQPQTCRSSA